jgi:TonB family protein
MPDITMPIVPSAQKGTAIRWPWLAQVVAGLVFCWIPHRLEAQPLGHAAHVAADSVGLAGAASPVLVQGQFAARIPKNMRLNASTLVQVSIWDKTAEAQARATLPAGPFAATDVRVGRLLQVGLAPLHSGEFAVHAMTPAKQLLLAGHVVQWEWTVVPLQPGAHELSIVATNLADFSGKPLERTAHSVTVNVEVTQGQSSGHEIGQPKQTIATRQIVPKEIGAAKHSFASFVTAMHRQIHRYWGDGFLAEIEHKSKDLYPDSLETSIEISIAKDGKIENLVIVKHSGSLPFDTAALDSVINAAPFPSPPDAIKSADGQVYLTWHFHRDERQCHPNFVDMHILTTPPDKDKRLQELTQKGSSLQSSPGAASVSASAKSAAGVPDGARAAAERWLAAYQKADARWLAGASGLPFTAGGKQIADDGPALRRFFQEMISEGVPQYERVTYYTPSQIHQKLGRLPRGGDEDDMAFAWVELAGEDLILLLSPTDRGWSVVGLDR